jgi:polysaccharide biosynthesis transport protein
MTRMLEALRRIEDRKPRAARHSAVLPTEASAEAAMERIKAAVTQAVMPDVAEEPSKAATSRRTPQPEDLYAELADRILAQLISGRPAAVLFTSAEDGEGKTETVAQLAPVLAQRFAGEVLAVDASLDRLGLAAHFGLEPLEETSATWANTEAWRDMVRPTSIPRLSVLPGGKSSTSVAPDVVAPDWGSLLRTMIRHYGLVLVDGPCAAHPDAARIACCCEATYLIVRLGRTSVRGARRAARALQQGHGRLLGCIVIE